MPITSPQNERIKLVRALQSGPKARRREGRIVLEGTRLIADALAAGAHPDFVLYTPEAADRATADAAARFEGLLALLHAAHVPTLEVASELLASAADTQTPQGVIAVLPMPSPSVPATLDLVLICDGVADPGNLGTILRSAAAAGVSLVLLAPDCVEPYNPKVLRSGMGAHFRLPVLSRTWPEIAALCAAANGNVGLPLFVADADGTQPYFAVNWREPAGLIIGGEARGARSDAYRLAAATIVIPMVNAAESLNAAAAAAVILFEARRQRLSGGT